MQDEIENNTKTKRPGRGALENPTGRFESIEIVYESEEWDEPPPVKTQFFHDTTKSIVTFNDSPDVGFNASINPYRGCEHGCIYCYARPTHEYLGLSCGLDFETKIFVKTNAAELLRKKLSSKSWKPQVIAMSGVTDCYQPVEKKLKLTRQCLEVLAEFRNPVGMITKNYLITRDIDLLSELASHQAACVFISLTTLDEELARVMEPRTAQPTLRLKAIEELSKAGIPVGVLMGPIIPGLTDHEIDSVLKHAAEAGAKTAGYTILRMPYGVKDLFQTWLETHYPNKKNKVINRIKEIRGGELNNTEFGRRMRGEGTYAQYMTQMFELSQKRHGLNQSLPPLSIEGFRNPSQQQLKLF
jgi:DNA repair photolyase